jgi:hypothetical protein
MTFSQIWLIPLVNDLQHTSPGGVCVCDCFFKFKLCDQAKVAIIHNMSQPDLAIKNMKIKLP